MEPTLSAGDLLYIDPRAYHDQLPEVGDVVVAAHPYRDGVQLVKRVAESDAMTVELRGDNPTSSTDSRTLGPIRQRRLLGRVVSVAR